MGFRIEPAAPDLAIDVSAAEAAPPAFLASGGAYAGLDDHVLAAQARALARGGRSQAVGGAIMAAIVWVTFARLNGDASAFLWGAIVHAAQALQWWVARHFQDSVPPESETRRWVRRFAWTFGLHGGAWGAAAALIAPSSLAGVSVLTLAVVAMAAGGLGAAVTERNAIHAWLLPVLGPLAVTLAVDGGPVDLALGGIVLTFLLLMLSFARGHHRTLLRALRTRYENAGLIEKLRLQMELAASANRDKSRFLAAASHDLRQPMHALTLFATALERRLAGTPDEPLMRNVNECIGALDRSFNALLDISRLDAGVVEPQRNAFAIRDVFRRLHMHFAGQADSAGLQLRFRPGGKMVTTDPQLLERILGNLIQNSIKYTRTGGVVVVARDAGDLVNIEVWDTGVGVAEKHLPRLFDEFFQLDNPGHDRSRGLGMGLAIVKRLALLLGHPLEVHSRPGKGTLFRIGVPRTDTHTLEGMNVSSDTLPAPMGEARTLLVIDDEEKIRESMALLLGQWGFQAVVAGSTLEACKVALSHDDGIHAIVSDLRLRNGEDGVAAIEAVRRALGHPLPAILVTGDTSKEQIQRIHDSGHVVLFKPVRPKDLYGALRELG